MNTASGAKMTKVSQDEILQSIVSFKRDIVPLGLNAKRVIGKRYSLKDAKGTSLEEWSDIVARVVAHVSVAETDRRSGTVSTPRCPPSYWAGSLFPSTHASAI